MKIAKISWAIVMTVLIAGVATSAYAQNLKLPDASSTSTLLLIGLGALGVISRSRKQGK